MSAPLITVSATRYVRLQPMEEVAQDSLTAPPHPIRVPSGVAEVEDFVWKIQAVRAVCFAFRLMGYVLEFVCLKTGPMGLHLNPNHSSVVS